MEGTMTRPSTPEENADHDHDLRKATKAEIDQSTRDFIDFARNEYKLQHDVSVSVETGFIIARIRAAQVELLLLKEEQQGDFRDVIELLETSVLKLLLRAV